MYRVQKLRLSLATLPFQIRRVSGILDSVDKIQKGYRRVTVILIWGVTANFEESLTFDPLYYSRVRLLPQENFAHYKGHHLLHCWGF